VVGVLAVGIGLALFVVLTVANRREKQFQEAKTNLIRLISQHLPALARKRAQLVRDDGYGKLIYDKWIKQIDYFVKEHITPVLSWDDTNIIVQKGFNIHQAVFAVVEQHQNDNPAFKAFYDDMTPDQFEAFCAEELCRGGWNARKTMQSRDQGVDVIAEKDGTRVVVQCKLYSRPVGNKAVQEVAAAKAHERADYGIVVSNHRYTQDAEQLAATNRILLLHYTDLRSLDSFIRTKSVVSDNWYYWLDDEEVGPLNLEELIEAFGSLPNAKDVYVRSDRFEDWRPAKNIPELKVSKMYAQR
jgi:hypothetical protein